MLPIAETNTIASAPPVSSPTAWPTQLSPRDLARWLRKVPVEELVDALADPTLGTLPREQQELISVTVAVRAHHVAQHTTALWNALHDALAASALPWPTRTMAEWHPQVGRLHWPPARILAGMALSVASNSHDIHTLYHLSRGRTDHLRWNFWRDLRQVTPMLLHDMRADEWRGVEAVLLNDMLPRTAAAELWEAWIAHVRELRSGVGHPEVLARLLLVLHTGQERVRVGARKELERALDHPEADLPTAWGERMVTELLRITQEFGDPRLLKLAGEVRHLTAINRGHASAAPPLAEIEATFQRAAALAPGADNAHARPSWWQGPGRAPQL
jgi:hypothetical protein